MTIVALLLVGGCKDSSLGKILIYMSGVAGNHLKSFMEKREQDCEPEKA